MTGPGGHSGPGGRAALHPTLARATGPRAFLGLLQRDIWNTLRHELGGFLAQSLMQPLAFLFVFGLVLPKIGAADASYGTQLLPGIIALTLVLTALQNVALPLVIEFSYTKEIEDRLLAPISPMMVGAEKLVFATGRSLIAALLILPLAALILPNGLQAGGAHWGMIAILLVVGGFAGASIGLVLGTMVPPNRINIIFAVALTPLIFTGATFYPWRSLDTLRWFQVLTLVNPLTYVSEGMRAALTQSPHLGVGWIALGLAVSTAVFMFLGLRGFIRRAVD
ncbi:ABC transporter permease [Rhodococcus sp. IEGM 1408]|uniref:ABC transporter permease n=1 Tax=Rhodococcus sp. IEGM 1408 TaxID=3082220 RepID=UPI002953094F|nr:ABC transporter permease [Rhodococcus sp. IEGM 1408]MDV8003055.1 ABC transporter permease [Rhodococcus sp. IEGM 1408]